MNKINSEQNNLPENNTKPMEPDNTLVEQLTDSDEMRSEYDFSGGIRGKHYKAYRQGHQVKIEQNDGSVIVQNFKLEEGAIFLDPDIKIYFPDSEAVNKALRGLIALIPKDKLVPVNKNLIHKSS